MNITEKVRKMNKDQWFEKLANIKVYFGRIGAYLSVINFLMILATFKLSYNIPISAYVIIPIGMIFAILIGYADYRFIMKYEIEHSNKQNNIKKQLDKIQKLLEEKK